MVVRKRIAYFGGSFDPPHNGHLGLAEAVVRLNLADEVWLAPAYAPPHKTRQLSSFDDRLKMVALACRNYTGVKACGDEREFALSPSYTFEVLRRLKKKYQEYEFLLLIGGDMLESLHSWYEAKSLLAEFPLIVYPRAGVKVSTSDLLEYWSEAEVKKLSASLLVSLPFFDISSTNIRNDVEKKQNTATSIDEAICEYIKYAGLYRQEGENVSENIDDKIVVTPAELVKLCAELADERKAENIVTLNVAAITFIADYFVICSANSTTQLAAIQSHIERGVRERCQVRPLSVEGDHFSGWMLVDFGSVLVHVMTPEVRDRYQLEKLWGDAPTDETRQTLEALRPLK